MLIMPVLKHRAEHERAILVLDEDLILLEDLLYHPLHQGWGAELGHPLDHPAAVLMLAEFDGVALNLLY